MATRRAYRSAEQWRSIIDRHQDSGLTVRAFCEDNGIGYASFIAWRRRFDVDPAPKAKISESFIELTPSAIGMPVPTSVPNPEEDRSGDVAPVTIELSLGGGVTLRITRTG